MMRREIVLLLFASISLIDSDSTIYKVQTKVFPQTAFQVPVNTHYINTLTNIRSQLRCAIACEQYPICRTAEYDLTNQTCRLFETLTSAGTTYPDPTKTTLMLDYSLDEPETEPSYICSRGTAYSVQQVLDQLAAAPNVSLSKADRGSYANMYGVYTTGHNGTLAFTTYNGSETTLQQISGDITNINSATSSGFAIVQYSLLSAIIYNNNGTSAQPKLSLIRNFSLSAQPYDCVVTPQNLYITYMGSFILMTILNLTSGAVSYVNQTSVLSYRPVIGQWQDTVLVLDESQAKLYSLSGVYQGDWPYFSEPRAGQQHYLQYDYAGRVFTCNTNGSYPGVYAFLNNGTLIARGPTSCSRSIQFYVTKEQVAFVNVFESTPGTMKISRFS